MSVHDYPGRYNTTTSAAGFYANLVSNDPLLPNVQEARAGILAGCSTCTGAQILMTEGAIYSCHGCNKNYTNAFSNALAVGAFVTEGINYGMVNFDLYELYNGGLSGNWMGPATPEPVYYLYSDVLSHMPLNDSKANLLNVTQKGGPGMMWFAATYAAPNHWTLLALNLNVTSAASLSLKGFPTSGAYTFYRWNGTTAQPVRSTGSTLASVTVGSQSLLLIEVNSSSPGVGLRIDGSALGSATGSNASQATLSTNSSSDVLIVELAASIGSGSISGCSDTAGLTWTQRASYTPGAGTSSPSSPWVFEWYALSAGPLSSDKITCSMSVATNPAMVVFAVAGANVSAPFDPGSGKNPCMGHGGNAVSCLVRATSSDEMVIGLAASFPVTSGNATPLSPGGSVNLTQIAQQGQGPYAMAEYSLLTYNGSYYVGARDRNVNGIAIIGDALW